MKKINTFVIPIIQPNYLPRMLETLYKFTEKDTFNVIVIDNSMTSQAQEECGKLVHMWIKPYRNLGFSKSMNTGIRLTDTKYVTLANDDIEFIDPRWWKGITDTFASDPKIVAVNPMSPKEGAWGYGFRADNKDTWEPPKGFARMAEDEGGIVPMMLDGTPFPIKENYSPEEYDFLLNNHPTWSKDSVCDAIAMWCTVFKTDALVNSLGLLEEKFYPGGGEDYDMNARAYSCAWPKERKDCDPDYHQRMVGTSRSWVIHHWSKSRNISPDDPIFSRPRWNNNDELWGPKFDVWGHYDDEKGTKRPIHRKPEIVMDEL